MTRFNSTLQHKIRVGVLILIVFLAAILWLEMTYIEKKKLTDNQKTQQKMHRTLEQKNTKNPITNFPEMIAFDEIIQRPLFNEDRLPFVAREQVTEKKVLPPKKEIRQPPKKQELFSLNAVIITSKKKIAVLQSGRNKSLQRISLGETIHDWTLHDVLPHSVQLRKGSESKNLELEIKGSKLQSVSKSMSKNKMLIPP